MSLYHLRTLLVLAAIGLALIFFLRLPKPRLPLFKWMGLLTALTFVVELFGYLSALSHSTNVPVYNAFVFAEFAMVLIMVRAQHPGWKRPLAAVAVVGLVGFACNAWLVDPAHDILFESAVWLSLLLSGVIGALLWRMANTSDQDLRKVPAFWLLTGMLLYFIALPPIVGLARYLRTLDLEMASTLWTIMPLLCTARYLLTAYACWLQGGRRRAAHE
jgi:hypothetical protein